MAEQWVSVTVHPKAGKDVLVSMGRGRFEAWVKARPIAGAANDAVRHLLASTLQVAVARVRLVKGAAGRHKVFRIVE